MKERILFCFELVCLISAPVLAWFFSVVFLSM